MRTCFLRAAQLNVPDTGDGTSPLLDFPFTVPAIRALAQLERMEFHDHVTFFIGENGAGKSTLLEGLADRLMYQEKGGEMDLDLGGTSPFTELRQYLRLERSPGQRPSDGYFLRAESFYDLVEDFTYPESKYGFFERSLKERSHGEGFLALLSHRLHGHGLYLFDEPEAALSVQSQFAALGFLRNLVQRQSQFIIATHSPILLAYPDAYIYRFSEDGIERVTYEQSEPYVLTRSFIENPQRMIQRIFDE